MSTSFRAYLGSNLIGGGITRSSDGFVRPTDWLALSTAPEPEGVRAIHAVFNSPSNFCAIRCQGAYTVDWGDGSPPQNYSNNAFAYYNYNWNNINPSTLTSYGYRQAVVTITPQAGNNLTFIHLAEKHNELGLTNSYSTGWLDINVNAPNLTSGGSRLFFGTTSVRSVYLKRVYIKNWGNLTSLNGVFQRCRDLEALNEHEWNTGNITSFSTTFLGCESLKSLDTRNWVTSAANTFNEMFRTCTNLKTIAGLENWNTSNVTTFALMFGSCPALFSDKEVLNLNNWNTANVTTLNGMFNTCTSLRNLSISSWNVSKISILDQFVNGASGLEKLDISMWNLSACTSCSNPFQNCFSIKEIKLPSLSSVTNFGANFTQTTNNLSNFTFPASGISASINFTSCCFDSTTLDYIYTNLSTVSSSPVKTITVTGNYGVNNDNPSIAQGKGWQVTG